MNGIKYFLKLSPFVYKIIILKSDTFHISYCSLSACCLLRSNDKLCTGPTSTPPVCPLAERISAGMFSIHECSANDKTHLHLKYRDWKKERKETQLHKLTWSQFRSPLCVISAWTCCDHQKGPRQVDPGDFSSSLIFRFFLTDTRGQTFFLLHDWSPASITISDPLWKMSVRIFKKSETVSVGRRIKGHRHTLRGAWLGFCRIINHFTFCS